MRLLLIDPRKECFAYAITENGTRVARGIVLSIAELVAVRARERCAHVFIDAGYLTPYVLSLCRSYEWFPVKGRRLAGENFAAEIEKHTADIATVLDL